MTISSELIDFFSIDESKLKDNYTNIDDVWEFVRSIKPRTLLNDYYMRYIHEIEKEDEEYVVIPTYWITVMWFEDHKLKPWDNSTPAELDKLRNDGNADLADLIVRICKEVVDSRNDF